MNLAVIKDQNTLWTGVWAHGGELLSELEHVSRFEPHERTTSETMKSKNLRESTEPTTMRVAT